MSRRDETISGALFLLHRPHCLYTHTALGVLCVGGVGGLALLCFMCKNFQARRLLHKRVPEVSVAPPVLRPSDPG